MARCCTTRRPSASGPPACRSSSTSTASRASSSSCCRAPSTAASSLLADWADARLISTANYGAAIPDTLTWQLSQGGVRHRQADRGLVHPPAISGTYTLTVTAHDAPGRHGTASTTVAIIADRPGAVPLGRDSFRQGDWLGAYGSQGFVLPGDDAAAPLYAGVSVTGATTSTWATNGLDPRAPMRTDGLPAAYCSSWSGSGFTIDVDVGDGQAHDLALYALDANDQGLEEQIQVLDALTGAVLDAESISSFGSGVYLRWAISGSVRIRVESLTSSPAVVNGLFFGAASSTTPYPILQLDGKTQGSWIGAYGLQGSDLATISPTLPSYASIAISGANRFTWASSTTDPRALQTPEDTGRIMAAWYSPSSMTFDVNLTDGQAHNLELYACDYDTGTARAVDLYDAATGDLMDSETISTFDDGVYLQWAIRGHVKIVVTRLGGLQRRGQRAVPRPARFDEGALLPRRGHDDAGGLDRHLRRPGQDIAGAAAAALVCQRRDQRDANLDVGVEHDGPPRPAIGRRLGPLVPDLVHEDVDDLRREPDRRSGAQPGAVRLRLRHQHPRGADRPVQRGHGRPDGQRDDLDVPRWGLPAMGDPRPREDRGHAPRRAHAVVSGLFLDPRK